MNIENPAPSYSKRTFYGPLELNPDIRQNDYRTVLAHPEDPSKLIREINAEGLYFNKTEMDETVYATQQILKGLSEYGVNHVDPSFFDETTDDERRLTAVVTRLIDVRSYDELIEGSVSLEQIYEIDQVLGNMFDYIAHAMEEEGYIGAEMMHLGQFVYDDSQPKGRKMVLVDTDPLYASKIDMQEDSIKNRFVSELTQTVARLVVDAITASNKAEQPLASFQKAASVIEALPGESYYTLSAKEALLHALDTHEISTHVRALDEGVW